MQYLRTFGAMEAMLFVVLVSIGVAVRRWLARADREGTYDRTRYVYRRGFTTHETGPWASAHRRSAAERNQPEQELPPLPFRDQPPSEARRPTEN
jgi:hypothetical protein